MSDFVKPSNVFLDNPASTVDEALAFVAKQAVALGVADDEQATLDAFKAREAEGTTGMSGGFAIPHAKAATIKQSAIIIVKFAGDVAWESMDNKPIKVAIALLVPDGEAGTTHLQLLSKIALLLMDEKFRTDMLADEDPASIAQRINAGLDE